MGYSGLMLSNDIVAYSFRDLLEFVEAHCMKRAEGLILLSCYLDAISGLRYGGPSSHDRFVNLLLSTNLESEWGRISVPTLLRGLDTSQLPGSVSVAGTIRKVFESELSRYPLERDADLVTAAFLSALSERAALTLENSHLKIIQRYRYASVFWRAYRSSLVHSLSVQPTDVPSLRLEERPFYCGKNVSDTSTLTLNLPIRFVLESVKSCVKNLGIWANENEINLMDRWLSYSDKTI